jgi:excisionase family DNA binding protein
MSTLRIIGEPSEPSTPPRSNAAQPQTPIRKPPRAKPVQSARRMLKLKAAAEYLGVSTWTLRRILRSGEIPYVQRGEGNILLDLRDLDADIEKNKRLG